MPDEFNLPRTGQSNLAFTGEILAHAKSPQFQRHERKPNDRNRWFEATVYSTSTGKHVIHLAYRFSGSLFRERPCDVVFVNDRLKDAVSSLSSYESTVCVAGYPEVEQYEDKQAILERRTIEDFGYLVADIENQLAALRNRKGLTKPLSPRSR